MLINSKPISEIVNEPTDAHGRTSNFLMHLDGFYFEFDYRPTRKLFFFNNTEPIRFEVLITRDPRATYAPLPTTENYRTISPCTIQHSTDMVEYGKGFVEREKE